MTVRTRLHRRRREREVFMYQVLLADDEIHVCQLIEHLVEWETLDAELCGTAHDGVEALDLIERLHPHVVISDIRM